jgi:hypothetical protein
MRPKCSLEELGRLEGVGEAGRVVLASATGPTKARNRGRLFRVNLLMPLLRPAPAGLFFVGPSKRQAPDLVALLRQLRRSRPNADSTRLFVRNTRSGQ